MKTVQETVQYEIKTYPSVLSKTCSVAFFQKKIQSAVKSAKEREDRSIDVVINALMVLRKLPTRLK